MLDKIFLQKKAARQSTTIIEKNVICIFLFLMRFTHIITHLRY